MERRRKERQESDTAAVCRVPASPHPGRIVDFSDSGCRVHLDETIAIPIGSTMHLDIGPGRRMSGQVMWSAPFSAGVRFSRPLPPQLAVALGREEDTLADAAPEEGAQAPESAPSILHHWVRRLLRWAA